MSSGDLYRKIGIALKVFALVFVRVIPHGMHWLWPSRHAIVSMLGARFATRLHCGQMCFCGDNHETTGMEEETTYTNPKVAQQISLNCESH